MAFPILDLINVLGGIVDRVIPDPKAKMDLQLQLAQLADKAADRDHQELMGQIDVNKAEASNANIFVAGWRPAVGWICAAGAGYAFLLEPLGEFVAKMAGYHGQFPDIGIANLMVLLTGMLGFGGLRTYEKVQGVAADTLPKEDVPGQPKDLLPANFMMALPSPGMAWGSKVSSTFRARVKWIADDLGCSPNDLMACMAWESGETFRANVKNGAGSGAVGLIQFMPSTAAKLGTTTAKLANMTAEDQLNYVYKYFLPYKGKLKNLGDMYMAILWPAGVGKTDDYVLFDKDKMPTTFRQNAGLDVNKNGQVTRGECLIKVNQKLAKGLLTQNVA